MECLWEERELAFSWIWNQSNGGESIHSDFEQDLVIQTMGTRKCKKCSSNKWFKTEQSSYIFKEVVYSFLDRALTPT